MSGKKLLYSVHTISKYTKLQSWIQIEEEEKIQGGYWIVDTDITKFRKWIHLNRNSK